MNSYQLGGSTKRRQSAKMSQDSSDHHTHDRVAIEAGDIGHLFIVVVLGRLWVQQLQMSISLLYLGSSTRVQIIFLGFSSVFTSNPYLCIPLRCKRWSFAVEL